jgi:hypothetical protein
MRNMPNHLRLCRRMFRKPYAVAFVKENNAFTYRGTQAVLGDSPLSRRCCGFALKYTAA